MTQPTERTDETAARWAVRLDAGPLPPEEQRTLEEWLAARPQHQGALIRARAAWSDLDRIAALAPVPVPATTKVPRTRVFAAAAALACAALLGALWFMFNPTANEVYASAVGEVRQVTLSDGSSLALNTASEARVQFNDARREIRLTQGEALFDVAKDPARPFIVRAGNFTVKALGTAFAVRIGPGTIDVTVTSGLVEIQNGRDAQRLSANQRATLSSTHPVEVLPITPRDADRHLVWRSGLIAFDGESLGAAIAEVNRHNRRHIRVQDTTLAARPVVGIFKATDPEGFARTAAAALGAHVSADGETIILSSTPK